MVGQSATTEPADFLPVVERFFCTTDRNLNDPDGPNAVVKDIVQLVVLGGVDESPAVLLAVCVEAVDGPKCHPVISQESRW